ncbi:RAMP superfamily CRISPR-associated protein [uncultured Fibrobacter sp.]|uniref:RAMP superfamily CRISPR-associated protein n=1 Tax=uncultured Fibrobacter sp. TaxID=261512 RepID=UPI00259784A9|nr:RAMP superfamily CRISPR-associated protein [uncultured Fibrobacter sp.]
MFYPCRILARVVLQAETPIIIGCGEKNGFTDSLIQKDVNGLPYIPASSIAGCLRHAIAPGVGKDVENAMFGFQKSGEGEGSRFIFTDGRMVSSDGLVVDGLHSIDFEGDAFYAHFAKLPIRDHVRISHKGAAEKGGKFDEEVVFKGTRFCFEVEFLPATDADVNYMELVLQQLSMSCFRIGGGTRSGFGKVKVVELCKLKLNLHDEEDFARYANKSSDLSDPVGFWKAVPRANLKSVDSEGWTVYQLNLKAADFFLFGSGTGDDEVDICNAMGTQIEWRDGKPCFSENLVLIPGSSVKGAISHRVAFIYNKLKGITAEQIKADADANGVTFQEKALEYTGDNNLAVRTLFGSQKIGNISRGSVLISDVMRKGRTGKPTKIMNHVSVDRFTGGAVEGALFSEKPWASDKELFNLELAVENSAIQEELVKKAFESTLKEIASGVLPLGGGVNRGNGVFKGEVKRNGEVI